MNSHSKHIHMMLSSKSRGGSIEYGKRRHSSIFSRTISASKLCRCDALGSQIHNNALVSLEKKSSVKVTDLSCGNSFLQKCKNKTNRLVMQEQMAKLEEELRDKREQLGLVEEEKNRAINELSEMKSREYHVEVTTLKELLSNKQEELKIKDKNINSLKLELEKAKKCELKLIERNSSLGKVKEGFNHVKAYKIRVTVWLSDFRRRVQELEDESKNMKLSESKIFDAWLSKTRQFEQIKIELEESKFEIATLHEKIETLGTCSKQNGGYLNHSCNGEISNSIDKEMENLRFEPESAKENEKIASSNANALNDEMKEMIKSTKARYKMFLDKAKKEAELYRNTTNRLKLDAEESLLAWNGKEMSFITCIKEVEEERNLALHEASKLNESLKATREENYRLRDILKQSINEAKAARDFARRENSQLKDCLAKNG